MEIIYIIVAIVTAYGFFLMYRPNPEKQALKAARKADHYYALAARAYHSNNFAAYHTYKCMAVEYGLKAHSYTRSIS